MVIGHTLDADLLIIARQCRHLKSFALRGLRCSVYAYLEISKLCCEIETMSLSDMSLTDEVVESMAVNLHSLIRLDISHCKELTNASLHSLATHRASSLKLLWLSGNKHITSDAIIHLKSSLPRLFVHFLAVFFEDVRVPFLNNCAVCTVLRMFDMPFNSMLPIITQCVLLQVLSLFPTGGISENTIDMVGLAAIINSCPHLHTIIVYGYEVAAMKRMLISLGSSISVIMIGGKENTLANLIEFPL